MDVVSCVTVRVSLTVDGVLHFLIRDREELTRPNHVSRKIHLRPPLKACGDPRADNRDGTRYKRA